MTPRHHKSRQKFWRKKWRSLYVWHRYLGLAAAALVVILSVTGVMLNHTDRLGLSTTHVSSQWLLDWYGISPNAPVVSYPLPAGEWLSSVDGRVFLNERPLGEISGPLVGAAASSEVVAVATPVTLTLYTRQGEMIERLDEAALPGTITRIGNAADGTIALMTDRGTFSSDEFITSWSPGVVPREWARLGSAPPHIYDAVLRVFRGEGLSWERVLLDLHSGRIAGDWGEYLMDGAAIILLILSGTGIYMWLKSRRRRS